MKSSEFIDLLKKYFRNCKSLDNEKKFIVTLDSDFKSNLELLNQELKDLNEDFQLIITKEEGDKAQIIKKHIHIPDYDHRKIGKKLNIFDLRVESGSGMPIWLENGWILKKIIISYVNYIQQKNGVIMVSTPELGKKELYQTSGHWDHYQENMFPSMKLPEGEEYILRPMTCPHHTILYSREKRHENQLPISFGENSRLYRYEYSGGLCGLERTRCMELIDTHMFCSTEQIAKGLKQVFEMILEIKNTFNINYHSVILALRNKEKEKFFDDDNLWQTSERILKEFLDSQAIEYTIGEGDAAFYGPKIDFQIKTSQDKIITISTIQLDFLLPQKFKLSYLDKSQKKQTPIMIHLGIIGTLERFVAYLLEQDSGWLPFWLSPEQISIIPINEEKHINAASKLLNIWKKLNLRASIEIGEESLSKKIAKIIERKVWGYVVVGDKECEYLDNVTKLNLKESLNLLTKSRGKSKFQFSEEELEFINWTTTNKYE